MKKGGGRGVEKGLGTVSGLRSHPAGLGTESKENCSHDSAHSFDGGGVGKSLPEAPRRKKYMVNLMLDFQLTRKVP